MGNRALATPISRTANTYWNAPSQTFESMITFTCQTITIVVIVAIILKFSADKYTTNMVLLLVEATGIVCTLRERLMEKYSIQFSYWTIITA